MTPTHRHDSLAASAGYVEAPTRRTRKQVSRACDWCRARKIRCDNTQPCKACRARDAPCTSRGLDGEPRTLPQALRENERLEKRVRELETLLSSNSSNSSNTTPTSTSGTLVAVTGSNRQFCNVSIEEKLSRAAPTIKPQWKGIYVDTAHSGRLSYYGAASSFYYVSRIGSYLGNALQQPHAAGSMQLRGPNRRAHRDTIKESVDSGEGPVPDRPDRFLYRAQEESVIRLFWEGYHCLLPVVDEVDFRAHYASLWEPRRSCRAHSPLVDVILALCLQYGYAYIPPAVLGPPTVEPGASSDDATTPGRSYYRRSQTLLVDDLESPSISTVQCYLLSVYYLCCGSFQNTSHIVLAQAVRAAHVLGLHTEPTLDMTAGEKELRRRLWWTLWMTDTKMSMKLGRPFIIDRAHVTVEVYADDRGTAAYNGATLGYHGDNVTWLTYALQNLRLFQTSSTVFSTLWDDFGDVIDRNHLSCIYTNPDAVEECAKTLAQIIPSMRMWTEGLPMDLKMRRRGGGEPYSTSCAAVEIDTMLPTWLQRQRVCLELTYHHSLVTLTRPFITFYSHPRTYTPFAERHATTCVDHAVSFTLIMHQVMTESDLMSNWSEFFTMQWNTAITIVGFILAYPIHQATSKARRALDKAIVVFDLFGTTFPVSSDAAAITRDLVAKADLLAGHVSRTMSPVSANNPPPVDGNASDTNVVADDLSWLDPSRQDGFAEFMDWALSVDTCSSFERLFNPSGSSFS